MHFLFASIFSALFYFLDELILESVFSVHELADEAVKLNKSVVQHYTSPCGTSNDFFGVTPKHQFLRSVLDHLPNSNRWFLFPYFNTILTTGIFYHQMISLTVIHVSNLFIFSGKCTFVIANTEVFIKTISVKYLTVLL